MDGQATTSNPWEDNGMSSRKLIISNVEGTIRWLKSKPVFRDFEPVPYLGRLVDQLEPGDIVVGTLPLALAADVCAKGAEYWHINFRRPRAKGRTLTAEELEETASVEHTMIEIRERII